MNEYKFSVIVPVYNVENYIEETIECLLNQTIGFEENIELILINDGSPDNSEEICLKYQEKYPNNIVYYKQKNAGVSAARNKGIELAKGEIINFLDSDDKWSEGSFSEAYSFIKEHPEVDVFSCKMIFFDAKTGNHPLNYKYKETKVVNVLEDYKYPQLSASSTFIRHSAIKGHEFDKTIKYSEDNKFINEIIINNPNVGMLKEPIYYYRRRFDQSSANANSITNKDWYLVTPKYVYKYLCDLSIKKYKKVIKYIEYLLSYELSFRMNYEKNSNLTPKERKEYAKTLDEIVEVLEEDIIIDNQYLNFPKKVFLLSKKSHKDLAKSATYDKVYASIGDLKIKKKMLYHLVIDQMYVRSDKIDCFGKLDLKYIDQKDFRITTNNKNVPIKYYELTNDHDEETYDGTKLHKYIGINFKIDLNEIGITKFNYKNTIIIPRFGNAAILTSSLSRSYHHINKKTILYKNGVIENHKRNFFKSFYYELRNDYNLLRRKNFRLLYARLYGKISNLFKKKEVWLISDRINKADDNGEHFFKYLKANHPEINAYFVLSKDCPDYERIKNIGKVLDPATNKYKLMFSKCDYVVSSHAENYLFNPLGRNGLNIRDQYHFKFIFLQHGITTNDLSSWLNVNSKKIDMFVSAVKPEYNSLLEYKYYFGKDVVKLTGFPRYDTLIKKAKEIKTKKQILVSFTWRNSLASVINHETGERIYNEGFKETDYFKNINNFINDKRILEALEKYGYRIKFVPHPNVYVQLKDFTFNKYIDVASNEVNYQKEFCENAMLITDYSSIVFDFGYLGKKVIYYQYDIEDFYKGQIYSKGYYDYEKMGFGPVTYDYESLVKETVNSIKNDCKPDKNIQKRIDSFFEYQDANNCKRVYESIKKI